MTSVVETQKEKFVAEYLQNYGFIDLQAWVKMPSDGWNDSAYVNSSLRETGFGFSRTEAVVRLPIQTSGKEIPEMNF